MSIVELIDMVSEIDVNLRVDACCVCDSSSAEYTYHSVCLQRSEHPGLPSNLVTCPPLVAKKDRLTGERPREQMALGLASPS